MKGFLVCILFFAAAGAASRHWTSEAVSAQRIAQLQAGVFPTSAHTCPTSHPIKGIFTTSTGERCVFHSPGGEFYSRTKPEMCYAMPADAVADGCRPSRR
jgi:hypothetical protein